MKCPIGSSKAVQKKERVSCDSYSDKNDVLVPWSDNRGIHMASNSAGVQPIKAVKRFGQHQKKRIDVFQPYCFVEYNQGMGGVDLLVYFIFQYLPTINVNKWYYPLFLNCINVIRVAAWQLYMIFQRDPKKTNQI